MRFMFICVALWLAGMWGVLAQESSGSFGTALAEAATEVANKDIQYNGAYLQLSYPWGDVPSGHGVCTDLVIRALRVLDVDLQQRVHEDMTREFAAYPSRRAWGLARPDRNIDHRRVLNLQTFFRRSDAAVPVTENPADYYPGDLVTWQVRKFGGGTTPHIGVVTARKSPGGTPLIAHHLSGRPKLEDVLFAWPVTGHYRYRVASDQRDR